LFAACQRINIIFDLLENKDDMEARPWLKNYPSDVPKEIEPNKYGSLVEMIENAVEKFGDRNAFCCMGTWISFNELDRLSSSFATFLQKNLGLNQGDRVAIQMPNLLQYPIALVGILKAGMIVVNTNPLYTPREMEHQFKDSGTKAILILENFACNLQEVIANTDIEHVIVSSIGEMHRFPKKQIINLVVRKVKKMVPAYSIPGARSWNESVSLSSEGYIRPELKPSDIAFLQYTGGTTGLSKGAALTNQNIIANVLQMLGWMGGNLVPGRELVMTPLPLYHIFSLTVNLFMMLELGAGNILVTNPRDMKAFYKDLKKYPFSVFTGVNTLYNGLLNQIWFDSIDFSHLKVAVAGGMALQTSVAKEWMERTKSTLIEGYGLTETSPVLSANPLDGSDKVGTIGLPFPNTDMKIVDDDGNDVAQGEAGEIVCKGPQVMNGYWEKPEETANVFYDDWFKTGDVGVMDEDGFFKIVDRKKDMILVSGFNVYPNEIEDVVAEHPMVLEVAAVGVADEKSTEAVKLFVVKKNRDLTEEELKEFCRKNLTGYKRPREIEFRDELPKSNVGKILRRHLRESKT
jgi:long-chain acyl-CoA synthetase